jgi:autotransporter-associated beta strand protein
MVILPCATSRAENVNVAVNGNINAAIQQVNAAGGGTVNLAAGNWTISSPINMLSNVSLVGAGENSTSLVSTGGFNVIQETADGENNMAVQNLNIVGVSTNTSSNGVYIDAGSTYNTNITISNVGVEDCGGIGCQLKRCNTFLIAGCDFQSNGITDLDHNCYCFDVNSGSITNSQFLNSPDGSGIHLNTDADGGTCDNVTISGCVCSGNGQDGMDIQGTLANDVIEGNTVKYNNNTMDGGYGIRIWTGSGDLNDNVAEGNAIASYNVWKGWTQENNITAVPGQVGMLAVTNGQSDLTASGSYSGGSPGTSTDVTFSNATYSPTAFTLNTNAFNLHVGTLNDLDATQTLTIQNTTSGNASTITLNGGSNSVAPTADDLLYVAAGSTLSIGTGGAGTLNLALAATGNIDVAGTANIGSVISGFSGLTKTGVGMLTISGASTYAGTTAVNAGALVLTGSLASTSLAVGGGNFTFSELGTNTQSFNSGGTSINSGLSTINNTLSTDVLALGALSRSGGGMVDFGTVTGNINTSTANATGTGIIAPWAVIGSGTALSYAVANGAGNAITALSGAGSTALATSGGSATTNYSISSNTTPSKAVTGNTLQVLNSVTSALTLSDATATTTLNGILNSGAAGSSLTISGGTLSIGANQELDIISNDQATTISSLIVDNSGDPSSVVFGSTNGGTLTLSSSTSTFRFGVTLNSGTLAVSASSTGTAGSITQGPLGTGTLTLNGGAFNPSVNSLTINNAINVIGTTTLDGSTENLILGGAFSGSGTLSEPTSGIANSVTFNGDLSNFTGALNLTSVMNNFFSPASGSTISGSGVAFTFTVSGSNGKFLAFANNLNGVTFDMGSLSGNGTFHGARNGSSTDTLAIGSLNTSTTFSGQLGITGSNEANFNVTKVGSGSLMLSASNSQYTGATTIENGALIAGAAVPSSGAGAFGTATTPIALGDSNTLTNSYDPSLLTGGAFSVARNITVGSATGTNSSTYTIGGNTDNNSTFSGAISLNQSLTVSQVANAGNNALTISGAISTNNGSTPTVTFAGPGNIILSNVNTYSGVTTISAGTLALATGTTNNIASSTAITIASGAALDLTNVNGAGGFALASGQAIGGSGTVTGALTVASGSTISAGTNTTLGTGASNTTGKLATGRETWAGHSTYAWKITGSAGGSGVAVGSGGSGTIGGGTGHEGSDWDDLIMGALTVNSTASAPVAIVVSGTPSNSLSAGTYSWVIAQTGSTTAAGINSHITAGDNLLPQGAKPADAGLFTLNTANLEFNGITDPYTAAPGAFSLEFEPIGPGGDLDLVLDYRSAPEPRAGSLVVAGGLPMLIARRRRSQNITQ